MSTSGFPLWDFLAGNKLAATWALVAMLAIAAARIMWKVMREDRLAARNEILAMQNQLIQTVNDVTKEYAQQRLAIVELKASLLRLADRIGPRR